MISRQSDKINDDFRLLGKELEKDYEVIYLCKTLENSIDAKLTKKIAYGMHIFTQLYHLATSKACVLDSYCMAASVLKHKKSLKIFQIWHSIGTLKQFGWQILNRAEGSDPKVAGLMKMHNNYDVVYCAGEAYKNVLAEGFNIAHSKIRIFTLPRVDLLKNESYIAQTQKSIYEKYPQLKEKQNVIYAPTFRKDDGQFEKHFQMLTESFDFEKFNLIVKLHPLSKIKIENDKIISDKCFSTFQMITVAHKFISDYSCVVYEAGINNIPLYFYNYDMDTYNDVRSLTIDYGSLPGFISSDPQEICQALNRDYDYDYLNGFIRKYIENTENCAQKMANDIKNTIK